MNVDVYQWLKGGGFGAICCRSSRCELIDQIGTPNRLRLVGKRSSEEQWEYGAITVFLENGYFSGCGAYFDTGESLPHFATEGWNRLVECLALHSFEKHLADNGVGYSQLDLGRPVFVTEGGCVAYADSSKIGSIVMACSGTNFSDELVSMDPELTKVLRQHGS